MKKIVLLVLTLTVVSQLLYAQCSPNPNNVYTFIYNGVVYDIIKENLNWTDAAACAVSRGGKLAEIESQAENDALFYEMVVYAVISPALTVAPDGGGASYLWIGGNDIATEGKWIWNGDNLGFFAQFWQGNALGSPVGGLYNNWGNEPDDFGGQDALGFAFTDWPMGVASEWNDLAVTNSLYFVIEYSAPISVQELKNPLISVFPNPFDNKLSVNVDAASVGSAYSITNLLGDVVANGELTSVNTMIDLSELPSGMYFLHTEVNKDHPVKIVRK